MEPVLGTGALPSWPVTGTGYIQEGRIENLQITQIHYRSAKFFSVGIYEQAAYSGRLQRDEN